MRVLNAANDLMTVSQPDRKSVVVRIDRDRIRTDAKEAMSCHCNDCGLTRCGEDVQRSHSCRPKLAED